MSHDFMATSARRERHIGNYQLTKLLGEGSFGEVWSGWHNPTDTAVAVKAIRSQQGHSSLQRRLPQEAECMAALHHPHIVQLFEVIVARDMVYLIMEYVDGGDLRDYLYLHRKLSENEARDIFRQLVRAVHHCHERGVVHRDLKPSNVLLYADMRVKLADFGLSVFFNKHKLGVSCGDPSYAAPETFLDKEYDGRPADVWSLGVLLYRMVVGHVPFEEYDLRQLKEAILRGKYSIPSSLSAPLQYLLSQLLALNPKERKSLEYFMPSLWLDMDNEEELQPSDEMLPSKDLDPWVTQRMVDMGFRLDQIEHALHHKTYDDIMGTYLLFSRRKSKVQYRTICVQPFAPPDLNTSQVPTQEDQPECSRHQQPGQKAAESAGPATSPTPSTATPGPRPESRTDTPKPRPESRTDTPGPRLESRTDTPGPRPESRNDTPGPRPDSRTDTRGPRPESRTHIPGPSMESRISTFGPSMESRISTFGPSTPGPKPDSRTDTPGPRPDSRTHTPGPRPDSRTHIPGPSMESRISTFGPSVESRTPSTGPSVESRTPSPGPSIESRTSTLGASIESRTPTPGPTGKSRTPTTGPSIKFRKVSRAPSPKWRKVSPRHSPKSRSATPRPRPKLRTASPIPRRKGKTTTSQPKQVSKWKTTTPPPIPDLESGSSIRPLISGLDLGTTTPQLISDSESRTTTPQPIVEPEPSSAIPPHLPETESGTATSPPSPESNATLSPAPQPGPGVSPSSHRSGTSGNQERTTQGRRGLARRCWDFFKKLCLRPCKKGRGRHNKVMPL